MDIEIIKELADCYSKISVCNDRLQADRLRHKYYDIKERYLLSFKGGFNIYYLMDILEAASETISIKDIAIGELKCGICIRNHGLELHRHISIEGNYYQVLNTISGIVSKYTLPDIDRITLAIMDDISAIVRYSVVNGVGGMSHTESWREA